MRWLFRAKQAPIANTPKMNTPPNFLFNAKFNNTFSSWNEDLSYLAAGSWLTSQDMTLAVSSNPIIREPIEQIADAAMAQAIMKSRILKNLHETLDNLDKECEEEDFEKFSETARDNAKNILNFIYTQFSHYDYDIYPSSNREIFITCNPQKGKGVSIVCDSNGSVAYFLTWDGKNSRFCCDEMSELFYNLLIKVFKQFDNLNLIKTTLSKSSSSKDSDFLLIEKKAS